MKIYEPCSRVSYIVYSKKNHKLIVEKAAGDIESIIQYCTENKMQFNHLVETHFEYLHFLEPDYPGRIYKFRRAR